jgi:hypothetical protein
MRGLFEQGWSAGRFLALALVAFGFAGCGKPPMIGVHGTVRIDGKPVEGCKVGLFPDVTQFNPDRHGFGFGISGGDGSYTIVHPQGEGGIWPGDYKVTLVAWIDRNGNPVAADQKPSEVPGGVQNRFPEEYEASDMTPLRVTVKKGEDNVFDFDVSAK